MFIHVYFVLILAEEEEMIGMCATVIGHATLKSVKDTIIVWMSIYNEQNLKAEILFHIK